MLNIFADCSSLGSVIIPSSVTFIGERSFLDCSSLTSVDIPNSVTSIGESAFENCTQLASIAIPYGITRIEKNTFSGCTASIILPDNILKIEYNALGKCKLYVNQNSISLLSIWNYSRTLSPYDIETNSLLHAPSLDEIYKTQTTIKVKVNNYYNGYVYEIIDKDYVNLQDTGYIYKKLCPNTQYNIQCRASKGGISFYFDKNVTTNPVNMFVNSSATSSSLAVVCSYECGDANVISDYIDINGEITTGNQSKTIGLSPNASYKVSYFVTVNYGESGQESYTFSKTITCRTMSLQLKPKIPKVISSGNVIVAASTNLDDEETIIGFEWRRTDWTEDFVSNSEMAYLYDGIIEGYIHNLNTDKLWKYRAYYESASGSRYYSEWMGIDPTNTSYFEPTIHTSPVINVYGNKANVKGYSIRGTDVITQQGFKYWKSDLSTSEVNKKDTDVPTDAKIVYASGMIMAATLVNLDYGSNYSCVAFSVTSENKTYYGETQKFCTSEAPSNILHTSSTDNVNEVARYNIYGKKLNCPKPGLNIIKMSDGKTKKVMIK